MASLFFSARTVGLVWMASVVVLAATFGVAPATTHAQAAGLSTSALESPGVRQEIARSQLQGPGPLVVSQGGAGGTGAASPPSGELVANLSTAFSDTWSAPLKPSVTRIFNVPVNYKGSDGAWHPIDDTLAASPLGGYENAANSFSLRLPDSLSSGVSITNEGRSVSFSLQGASTSLPSVSGDTATYAGVLPSTDLSYVSQPTGVREIATLKDANAPTQMRYSLSLPAGLSPRQAADGSIALADGQGAVWFTIPAPTAFRPSAGPASGRPLPSIVTASGSGWVITVDTSEAWLREELSTGPVAIDPTVTVSASQACSLAAETPKTSSCSSSELRVGYDATHQENHALLKFNVGSLPLAAVVLNAKLGLYVEAHSTSSAKAVAVYRATKPWTTSASWETYDGSHPWTAPGGDYANPETHSDVSVNPAVGASTGWYYWYPTKMVQEWVNTTNAPEFEGHPEGYANEGLIVKDQTDNATANMLTVPSPAASSNKPYLEITYQTRGAGSEPQYTQLSTPLTDKSTMSVNVASGNLMLQSSQLQMAGVAGAGFTSTRRWNGLNGEKQEYGHWGDSNSIGVIAHGDGSLSLADGTGAWFEFQKQASGSFVTPPGIKATMCSAGSPLPCPASLPSGISYQLIYDQSQERVNFNVYGSGVQRQDRYGNKISKEYPAEDRVVLTDTQGRKIEHLTEGPEDYTSEIKDLSGSRNVKFSYETFTEGEPELATATDANGKTTTYGYSNYTIVKITDPTGNVTKLAYDTQRRVTEIIRTNNAEHTKGPTTKFKYYKVGEAPTPCTATQQATVVTDPDGVAGASGHTETYCANVLDEVDKAVDAEGHEAKLTFDPFGNVTSATTPARETGGSEGLTSLVYGEGGQNLNCEVQGTGKEIAKTCPSGALEKGYSNRYAYEDTALPFQPSEAVSARQKVTKLCYWGGSNACTVPEGEKGENGALKQQTDALASQNTLNYSYNKNGTAISSTDADGHKTSYEYDASGNLKTVLPPSGSGLGKKTITVDTNSRPHTVTQCLVESGGSCTSSETATLTYDKLDRVTEAVDTGPGATKTFKYTYDADGNLEKRIDPAGTTNFTHDPLNRLTEESLPGGATNAYSFDEASNLASFTDASGTTGYFYNTLNQLESMYEPGGNCGETPSKCTRAVHDNVGSLTKMTYPSGATLNYAVDPIAGRPTSITAKNPAGETLLSHSYSYLSGTNDTPLAFQDVYSQPGTASSTTTYEYDVLDRLLEATTTGTPASYYRYTLDGAGNRTSQKVNTTESSGGSEAFLKYNAGNLLECRMKTNAACSKSSSSELSGYSYDGAGNQTAITGYSDPASTSFSYNNINQLKGLTPPSSSEQSITYLGSGQSNLVGLGANTLQNSALGLTKQVNEVGTSYYARTPGGLMVDERLPGGSNYNPIYDAQGDVIGLLNSSGALVQTIRYGPYGENSNSAGSLSYSATSDPFLFQGGYHLAGGNAGAGNVPNNLYHYGARYYDPTNGRWTQNDPTGEGYLFAGGDPANERDPSGLCLQSTCNALAAKYAEETWGGPLSKYGVKCYGPYGNAHGVAQWHCYGKVVLSSFFFPWIDFQVFLDAYGHVTSHEGYVP
jgi:RHS repeat-associated protein